MKYYKVIKDGKFIGVSDRYGLLYYQEKYKIFVPTDRNRAEYIMVNEKLYRDDSFSSIVNESIEYEFAEISEISKEEYDQYRTAVENEQEIKLEEIVDETEEDVREGIEFDIKELKISEMKKACTSSIAAGIDVEMNDGETHHFSLGYYDQINIERLYSSSKNGETVLPYHSDGEKIRNFSSDEICALKLAKDKKINLETAYLECIKTYVESLDNVDTINSVSYGMKIPTKFKTSVYKLLSK